MNLKSVLAILFSLCVQNVFALDEAEVKTVISEGVGIDPQNAAQNAAQNALTNVVGSFMDTTTLLQKKSLITDGIKSETKNISKDIKDYSQGSIKSFEIIETKQEAGLTKLTAKVSVRNENFSAYIKKLAEGEVKVSGGLFAKAATETKQNKNLNSILIDSVIEPILSGEVQDFIVEEPMIYSQAIKDNKLPVEVVKWRENYRGYLKADDSTLITFKVNTELKKTFIENLNNILKSNSSIQKIDTNTSSIRNIIQPDGSQNSVASAGSDYFIFKANNYEKVPLLYESLIGRYNTFLKNGSNNIDLTKELFDFYKFSLPNKIDFKNQINLKISIKDKNNSTILVNTMNDESIVHPFKGGVTGGAYGSNNNLTPWNLSVPMGNTSLILEKNSFYVLLPADLETIKNAEKIVVTLEK